MLREFKSYARAQRMTKVLLPWVAHISPHSRPSRVHPQEDLPERLIWAHSRERGPRRAPGNSPDAPLMHPCMFLAPTRLARPAQQPSGRAPADEAA